MISPQRVYRLVIIIIYPSVHREKGADEEREKEHEVYVLNKREQGDGHEEPAGLIVDVADVPGESLL